MRGDKIDWLLSRILPPAINYLGVFARDQIPKSITTLPACYIINTDPSSAPGQHWLAVFHFPTHTEFFDSYGLPALAYSFSFPTPLLANTVQLQSDFSSACGYYCIAFLFSRAQGFTLAHFVRAFSPSNHASNDKSVFKWIRSHFANPPPPKHHLLHPPSLQQSVSRKQHGLMI